MEKNLILKNRLSPGDVLMMTVAIRDLHKTYPGEYLTDVRSPCPEIFENNPYMTPLNEKSPDVDSIDMMYPIIHESGQKGCHFSQGHRKFLAEHIGKRIDHFGMRPEIYLNGNEQAWPSPVVIEHGYTGPYWIINAGIKSDYPLKYYHRYQEVVDELKGEIQFVQVGHKAHNHPALDGVLDMRGKTTLRQLFRLSADAEGSVNVVSLQMVIMAAMSKPCVVVAGAREGVRWQLYPDQQFIYVNGCLPCATWDGCWKSKEEDCTNKKDGVPACMTLIEPHDIVRSINRYYDGGRLTRGGTQ